MSSITKIQEYISKLETVRPDVISRLRSVTNLVAALKELDAIVEMAQAKESICLQTKYILDRITRIPAGAPLSSILQDHMLHTVISGPPGVGKTQLGRVLAKIWHSLGILNSAPAGPPEIPAKVTKKFLEDYRTHIDVINDEITQEIYASEERLNDFISHRRDETSRTILNRLKKHQDHLWEIVESNKTPRLETGDSNNVPFHIGAPADFIGKYVGHTAPQTIKFLEKCVGGVLFIDEAYSLITHEEGSFGMEALTEINKFMSERPNDLIVIMAGYKDLLDKSVFRAQPGLKRRFAWTFDIKSYTEEGLSKIFQKQLSETGWELDPKVDLVKFFKSHKDAFPHYGGDTHRLAYFCKLCQVDLEEPEPLPVVLETGRGKRKAQSSGEGSCKRIRITLTKFAPVLASPKISEAALEKAFRKFKENSVTKDVKAPPMGMYL